MLIELVILLLLLLLIAMQAQQRPQLATPFGVLPNTPNHVQWERQKALLQLQNYISLLGGPKHG